MINSLQMTQAYLKKYDLVAKKKYGQNFLVEDSVLQDIAALANLGDNELIIEIGPGLGNLTQYLLESELLLIEIDTDMIAVLEERFKHSDTITIVNTDILQVKIDEIVDQLETKRNKKYNTVKVVANLPYYITSPILFKLLEESQRIDEMIVMVQEEVADRMVASPKSKEYGILTLMISLYADAHKEIVVDNKAFLPSPNVMSAVVKMVRTNTYASVDKPLFKELVHKAFANRRKKMLNSLAMNQFQSLDKAGLETILKQCDINTNARAEELPMETYLRILEKIKSN